MKNKDTTYFGIYRRGEEFINSALQLNPLKDYGSEEMNLFKGRENISFVSQYLLIHGLELQLKSFLYFKGKTISELRGKNFGHDIVKIFKACEEENIYEIIDLFFSEEELITINNYYKHKLLEYYNGSGVVTIINYHRLAKVIISVDEKLKSFYLNN